MQEPKYQFDGGRIVNRASGEAIPLDEPVMVFRARDVHAIALISAYLGAIRGGPIQHQRAVEARLAAFHGFALEHPERMKLPDTDYDDE